MPKFIDILGYKVTDENSTVVKTESNLSIVVGKITFMRDFNKRTQIYLRGKKIISTKKSREEIKKLIDEVDN